MRSKTAIRYSKATPIQKVILEVLSWHDYVEPLDLCREVCRIYFNTGATVGRRQNVKRSCETLERANRIRLAKMKSGTMKWTMLAKPERKIEVRGYPEHVPPRFEMNF